MIRLFATEIYKEILIDPRLTLRYAITNYGRLISFTDKPEEGRLVKGSLTDGYRILRYKIRLKEAKYLYKHVFFYHLVAEAFLEKKSPDQTHILHLDRNRANDFVGNLKWATKAEQMAHVKNSPMVMEAKRKLVEHRIRSNGNKLTVSQVILLKKKLLDPNRRTRLKLLARQFKVSEMTLHRIRTGENWGHIKV